MRKATVHQFGHLFGQTNTYHGKRLIICYIAQLQVITVDVAMQCQKLRDAEGSHDYGSLLHTRTQSKSSRESSIALL